MTDDNGAPDGGKALARRVHLALCLANGIALNECAFMFLGGGFRIPSPGIEHLGTLVLLAGPAIVANTFRPGQRLTILRAGTTALSGALIAILHAFAGALGLVLVVVVASCFGASAPRPGLVVALLAMGSTLALVFWRCLRFLRPVAWVLPAVVAGTRVFYVPPTVLTRLDDGGLHFLVEAGMEAVVSDGDVRVCATTTVVSGVLEWWQRLEGLPNHSRDVSLRMSGDDLIAVMPGPRLDDPPVERRIRVR